MGNAVTHRLTLFSFLSLWIIVYSNSGRDLEETPKGAQDNQTELMCQQEFSAKVDACINGFLLLHHQLGLISNNRNTKISVIYISIHRDMYCKSYITSLQCIHESLSSCSTDSSTSLVQHRLSQLWALTANQICHINDQTNHHQHILPDQITELLMDSSVGILKEIKQEYEAGGDRDLDKGGEDLPDIPNKFNDNTDQNEKGKLETEITQKERVYTNVDNSMDQYEPLMKLFQHFFTPTITEDSSHNLNTPSKYEVTGKPGKMWPSQPNVKVRYETVLLKKLRITNIGAAEKKTNSDADQDRQTSTLTDHNSRKENSVVKEFEISTENRKSRDKKTKTTTYKWKTKLKGTM